MPREREASFEEMMGAGAPAPTAERPQQEASFDEMMGIEPVAPMAPVAPELEKPSEPWLTSETPKRLLGKLGNWFSAPLDTKLLGGTSPTAPILGLAPRMNDAGQVVDEQGAPVEVKQERSLGEWLHSGPTIKPRGFVGQSSAIVEDLAKFAPLMAEWMFYDLPKTFTDPLVEYVSSMHKLDVERTKEGLTNEQLAAKQGEVGKNALQTLGDGIYQQLRGLQGFMLSPFGYYAPEDDPNHGWAFSREQFEKSWTERPFSTAVALTPLIKAAVRVKADIAAGRKPAPVTPQELGTEGGEVASVDLMDNTNAALAIDVSRRAREATGETPLMEQIDLAKAYEEAAKPFEGKIKRTRKKKEAPVEPSPVENAPLDEGVEAEIAAEKAERAPQTPEAAIEEARLLRAKNTEEPVAPIIEQEPSSLVERKLPPKMRKRVRNIKEEAATAKQPKPATAKEEPKSAAEKDLIDLTDDELDALARGAAIDERIPEPTSRELKSGEMTVEELAEESRFATDAAMTATRAKQYADRPKLMQSSPEAALMKYVNDVNRWRHGEAVDIAATRATLDEFASNAGLTESWFDNRRQFKTFEDTAKEAAGWAKRAERGGGEGGTTLSMGVDPTRLADLLRRVRDLSGIGNLDVRNEALQKVASELNRDEARALMDERAGTSASVKELSAKGDFDAAMREATVGQHLREVAEESGKLESIDARHGIADPVGGTKLRMGLDIEELAKPVQDAFDLVLRTKAAPPFSDRAKRALKAGRRAWLDSSGNIKEELRKDFGKPGEETAQALALTKGATGEALRTWESVYKPIFGKLGAEDLELLNRVAFARRVLQIDDIHGMGKIKHPGGTAANYAAWLEQLEGKIGKTKFEDLWSRASAGFEVARKMLDELEQAGVITKKVHDALYKFDYTQREMIEMLDPSYVMKVGTNPGTVRESGVSNIRIGKESEVLETSLPTLLQNIIIRGKNRIAWNNANQMMADLARSQPAHLMIALTKEQGGRGIPENFQRFEYYNKGEKQAFGLHPDWAQEWVRRSVDVSYDVAKLMRWASGSPIVRALAVGLNPPFQLTNPWRDLARIILVSQHYVELPGMAPGKGKYISTYSRHLPVALLQTARNLAEVLPDAIFKRGDYIDFVKEGGSPQFLVRYGLGSEPMQSFYVGRSKHAFRAIVNGLAWLGEVGELAPRLALRKQAIRKGLSSREATFLARDILDPSQGGAVPKFLDNSLPFFNIATQASRGLFRSIARNPVEQGYKIAQLMGISAALHVANRMVHGDKYDEFSDRDKQDNHLLPLPGAVITDEYGNERQLGYKIPKDQGERFFSFLAQSVMDKMMGREVDVDGIVKTLSQLAPISSPSQLIPPSIQFAINLTKGYDFWTNEKYWKGDEHVATYAQYREGRTPDAAIAVGAASKKLGDLIGTDSVQLSPEALVGALRTMALGNSVYGQLAGAGIQKMLDDYEPEDRKLLIAEMLARYPVSSRFATLSHPLNAIRDEMDDAHKEVSTARWANTTRFDRWAKSALVDKTATIDDVVENAILTVKDEHEQKRLLERLEFKIGIQDLPHHAFWMQMQYLGTAEARAKAFYREEQRVGEKERAQLLEEMGRVGSLVGKEFWEYYAREVEGGESKR